MQGRVSDSVCRCAQADGGWWWCCLFEMTRWLSANRSSIGLGAVHFTGGGGEWQVRPLRWVEAWKTSTVSTNVSALTRTPPLWWAVQIGCRKPRVKSVCLCVWERMHSCGKVHVYSWITPPKCYTLKSVRSELDDGSTKALFSGAF